MGFRFGVKAWYTWMDGCVVSGLGFGFQGLGFEVWGLGFAVWGLEFEVLGSKGWINVGWVSGLGFRD